MNAKLWLHKSWVTIKSILLFLFILLVIFLIVGIVISQLPTTRLAITAKIEHQFNNKYQGMLEIGSAKISLPTFNIDLFDVSLKTDSLSEEPVFFADTLFANMDFIEFIRGRLNFNNPKSNFVVKGLNVINPILIIDAQSENSFFKALKKEKIPINTVQESINEDIDAPFFEILARVRVKNGDLIFRNDVDPPEGVYLPDSVTFRDINLNMYFEYKREERFVDIDYLNMRVPEYGITDTDIYGQVYNTENIVEFNALSVKMPRSFIKFNFKIDGIDIFAGDILGQFKSSKFNFDVDELMLDPRDIQEVYTDFPHIDKPFYLSLSSQGKLDSLQFNSIQFLLGNSGLNASGYLTNMLQPKTIGYGLSLSHTQFERDDLASLPLNLTDAQLEAISNTNIRADFTGDLASVKGFVNLNSERGSLNAQGRVDLNGSRELELEFSADSLNLGGLLAENIQKTDLTLEGSIISVGFDIKKAVGSNHINLSKGFVNDIEFDSIRVSNQWSKGLVFSELIFLNHDESLKGNGSVDLRNDTPELKITGNGENLRPKNYIKADSLQDAIIDFDYKIDLKGSNIDNFYGAISLDFPQSVVGGDTLTNYQIYADFNDPAHGVRHLRLTSTAFDMELSGKFKPSELLSTGQHWGGFFRERIDEEFLFKPAKKRVVDTKIFDIQNIDFTVDIKNIDLIRIYLPSFPLVQSSLRLRGNFNADFNRLLFSADVSDSSLSVGKIILDSLDTKITGNFRYADDIKTFSNFEIQANIGRFKNKTLQANGFSLNAGLKNDSLHIKQSIKSLGEVAGLDLEGNIFLQDTSLNARINNFEFGNNAYKWTNRNDLNFLFNNTGEVLLEDFTFVNNVQIIDIHGRFSANVEDSVNYMVRGVNLARISDLIKGRINFSGDLNGDFTTRTLTKVPTIQGDLTINKLAIDDQVVGDIEVESQLNQTLSRFDTRITITTDSTKYPEYFLRNDRNGQNISLNGYIVAPEDGKFPKSDSLFKFDLNFDNIDLWILPFIAPKAFVEMAGSASGKGRVWGNQDTYDYRVDYEVGMEDAIYIKPQFLETFYYCQGPISMTRKEGFNFKNLFLIDPSGGSATLSGYYNFNDFKPEHNMDIKLAMNNFQFLNREFDANAPFYGKAYGSGIANMTGTNLKPILTTLEPIRLSSSSEIGIPLLEETKFDEDNNFIQFVNSFEPSKDENDINLSENEVAKKEAEQIKKLSFAERFTIDLQFIASNPITLKLVFDPVTGDILTAGGAGQLRIRLVDEDLSMYGRINVNSGNYQFVTGGVFRKKFNIESGGTIIWEGAPTDALLDITAVYRARPNINNLTQESSQLTNESVQRASVELVLHIGGSLTSIQNDFFFRLPENFESRQNSTLNTQLEALNRNEDEKLIQATSFIIKGDFIPSSTVSPDQSSSLTESFTGNDVINPLLSSSVISPLLSNQINSLLKSDVTTLDVDFNLDTYNNVDLGLALRLYNDKLILRREGQVTGAQSTIGDLGATYRINRTFSMTVFHRQDPTFSNYTNTDQTQQSQDINGLGLEAEVSFHTWKDFFRKLARPFRKIFGRNKTKDNITEVSK